MTASLPITCSSAEFAAHVGSGVAIYMHFVKMTGWMFFVATIISLPQFAANLAGSQLKLEWPVNNQDCANSGGLMGLVSVVMQGLGYVFYSCLLGNVDFSVTQGIPHLASEMLLSMMFCVYVYWIWWYNNQVLTEIEANRTRASDFAVLVSRLPPLGSDPESLRQHFSFFGPVASVAVSTDRHALLGALQRHRQLKARWRHLHLECHRSLKALRALARTTRAACSCGPNRAHCAGSTTSSSSPSRGIGPSCSDRAQSSCARPTRRACAQDMPLCSSRAGPTRSGACATLS